MRRAIVSSRFHRSSYEGNLYYVRLNTDCGVFYKLGFTTLESVEARLSYGGSDDWRYIDKVFLFLNLPDAYKVEQQLHSCLNGKKAFGQYSSEKEFPLSNNGQTELYIEDVLGLDPEYQESQRKETLYKLKDKRLSIAGKTHQQDKLENIFVAVVARLLLIPLAPIGLALIILFSKLEGDDTKKEVGDFFDRITGGKRSAARESAELKANLKVIMSRVRREMYKSKF